MINGYKIYEDVLILYIDNSFEFGIDFKTKHNSSNMIDKIKKYIKKNKIKFDGDKIALSIGGIVLAVLLVIEPPSSNNNFNLTFSNTSILPTDTVLVVNDTNKDIITTEEIEEVENNDIKEEKVEVKEKTNTLTKTNETKKVLKKVEENVTLEQDIKEEIVQNEEKKVTIYRNNGQVISIPITDYLIGVVGAEMPASFNIEALKAQAVIARTYALKRIEKGLKLTDTVSTQSYLDNSELEKKWGNSFNTYYNKIKEAVLATEDKAIYYNGEYIDAVYHSTSNGKTEDSKYVWGNSIPYLVSVDSSWDKDTTSYLRTISKDLSDFFNILGVNSSDITILSRNESGRVLEIGVGDKVFSGVEFRNLLGLRSSDFDLEILDDTVNITTRGYGHGVGLSQYGANEMAKNGYNYEEIVKYYYKGVNIR